MTVDQPPRITVVTVSKDRALQLDGTLRSLASCCTDLDLATVYVLYKASTPRHRAAYRQLATEHPSVGLWPESSFRPDLIELVRGSDQVLFVVDDTIFLDTFSLATCAETLRADPTCIGFSLRLGTNTTYCYPSDATQEPPPFEAAGSGVLTYEWNNAGHDFGYPLEVSSSLYRTSDVLPILSERKFDNPNSLERMLSRQAESFVERRPRLACFERSVAVSVPANVVQTVFKNRHDSDPALDAEALADAFERGERLDVDRFRGLVTNGCHQELEFTFKHDPATRTVSVEDDATSARAEITLRRLLAKQLPPSLRRKNRELTRTAARAAAIEAADAGRRWRGLQIALYGAYAIRDWRLVRLALAMGLELLPGGSRLLRRFRARRRGTRRDEAATSKSREARRVDAGG